MESAVKLGELADKLSGEGIGLATVRSLLASNPECFAYHERKWIPAARLQGQGRPFAEAMAIVLHRYGGPMAVEMLVTEISRIRRAPEEEVEEVVRRIAKWDRNFASTANDEIALTDWGFKAMDEALPRALALNNVTQAEFDSSAAKLQGIDWRSDLGLEQAIQKAAPIRMKVLGAVAYAAVTSPDPKSVLIFDCRDFFSKALSVPGFVFSSDGMLHPLSDAKKWISTTVKLADKLAPTVELDDAAPIDMKPEDIDRIVAKILNSDTSSTATRCSKRTTRSPSATRRFPTTSRICWRRSRRTQRFNGSAATASARPTTIPTTSPRSRSRSNL